MKPNTEPSHAVDLARETLCQQISELLQTGANHVRVRLHRQGGSPDQAWFYAHQNNQWHKQGAGVTEAGLAAALEQELEMLASRGKSGNLSVRKVVAADHTDFDLQFDIDLVHAREGGALKASVQSILFSDAHASGKDVRHGIRTPHRGA